MLVSSERGRYQPKKCFFFGTASRMRETFEFELDACNEDEQFQNANPCRMARHTSSHADMDPFPPIMGQPAQELFR